MPFSKPSLRQYTLYSLQVCERKIMWPLKGNNSHTRLTERNQRRKKWTQSRNKRYNESSSLKTGAQRKRTNGKTLFSTSKDSNTVSVKFHAPANLEHPGRFGRFQK